MRPVPPITTIFITLLLVSTAVKATTRCEADLLADRRRRLRPRHRPATASKTGGWGSAAARLPFLPGGASADTMGFHKVRNGGCGATVGDAWAIPGDDGEC